MAQSLRGGGKGKERFSIGVYPVRKSQHLFWGC
jgi:hypothetical protein